MISRPSPRLSLTSGLGAIGAIAAIGAFAACSSGGSSTASNSTANQYVITVPQVSVDASSERYLCYAFNTEQDLQIDQISYPVKDYVHHLILATTTVPEPAGVNECDVAFKTTWIPLFLGGKGGNDLTYPAGDANVIPKGTQIVVQLHLLNSTSASANVNVQLSLHESTATNPTPVGLYAFGTQVINLPPSSTSSVQAECTPAQDVNTFAMFAHEHQLGASMTLEAMTDAGTYQTVYSCDPFDFNAQTIEEQPLFIAKGTKTRITCSYNNTTTDWVSYGESSTQEMCYLATFVPGQSGAFGCVVTPPDDAGAEADAGACTPTANALGIGGACTAGGNQCGSGLSCSGDLNQAASGSTGFCMKIGCLHATDCGASGATCCTPAQGGGAVNVCLPSGCVPSNCAVQP